MENKVAIQFRIWYKNDLVEKYAICRVSKSKHKALKSFGNYYWFAGLTGKGWFRGGNYPTNNGIISEDIQGVVLDNEVYLIEKIVTEKPQNMTVL